MLPSLKVRLLSVLREWSSITEMGGGGGVCTKREGGGQVNCLPLKKKQGAEVEKVSAMLNGGGGGGGGNTKRFEVVLTWSLKFYT